MQQGTFYLIIRAIWLSYWSDGNVPSVENLARCLKGILDNAFIESIGDIASDSGVKAQLSKNTQEAIDLGAFGLPWYLILIS
jgi:2-hydroxychromene-2-carboxylate isomerase